MTPITFPDNARAFDHLIVHCFATPPSMDDLDALWIDRVHRRKGWTMGGYQAIIKRDGTLEHETTGHRTRPYSRIGSHVGGCGPSWNGRSIGVSMAGGVKEDGRTPEDNFTEAQYNTLARYIDAACEHFGISHDNVMGHRDLIKQTNAAPKACPCFSVREFLGTLDTLPFPTPTPGNTYTKGEGLRVYRTYTIQSGDTLWSISNTLGVPVQTLRDLNRSIKGDLIVTGDRIRLRN